MTKSWTLYAIALGVAAQSICAFGCPHQDRATELVDLVLNEQMIESQLETVFESLPGDVSARRKLKAIALRFVPFAETRHALIEAYANAYETPELDALVAFYGSPVGQKVVAGQTRLNQVLLQNLHGRLQERLQQWAQSEEGQSEMQGIFEPQTTE
jgi:hypothetical protein